MKKLLLSLLAVSLCTSTLAEENLFRSDETPVQRDARMAWWKDAKFGMFVHWGIYAAAEGQWKGAASPDMRPGFEWLMCKGEQGGIDKDEYVETLAPKMTLANFDPEQWAELAADAGMKYFVITAKHHDGFGMVDFPFTDLDIADRTPYAADPMIPLSKAMRAHGLKFGFYFSQSQDWSRPGARPPWYKGLDGDWNEYVETVAAPQLRHLLGGTYGKIDMVWFDSGSCTKTREGAVKIWQEFAEQPEILVNNRLKLDNVGDFDCPEQWVPPTIQTGKAWETCMTMNGGWGYNPTDTHWKTTDELIQNLCKVVSRGGNYLLNIGPRADGSWEPQVVERLHGIGTWMKVNGESIYGTRTNPLGPVRGATVTWKPNGEGCRLYVHILNWPADGQLRLPLKSEITAATFLEQPTWLQRIRKNFFLGAKRPEWESDADSTIIQLNRNTPISSAASVLALDLKNASPEALPPIIQQEADGSVKLPAVEAQCEGGVYVHYRDPQLDGWNGKNQDARVAHWVVRVCEGGKCNLSAKCGFNSDQDVSGMTFVVSVDGQEIRIPVEVTGVETDPHNKENNRLVFKRFQCLEKVDFPAGLHTIELRAEGAPKQFKKPKGRANKQLCYSAFPMLEELRLVPAKQH